MAVVSLQPGYAAALRRWSHPLWLFCAYQAIACASGGSVSALAAQVFRLARGMPVAPGRFLEGTSHMSITGFGDGALPAALAGGDQAQDGHPLPRTVEPVGVPEFGHHRGAGQEVHAPERRQRLSRGTQ